MIGIIWGEITSGGTEDIIEEGITTEDTGTEDITQEDSITEDITAEGTIIHPITDQITLDGTIEEELISVSGHTIEEDITIIIIDSIDSTTEETITITISPIDLIISIEFTVSIISPKIGT